MASLHACWWERPETSEGPWLPLPAVYDPSPSIRASRDALLTMEGEPWACNLLGTCQVRTLLCLLDDPCFVLDILQAAPRTLIATAGDFALARGEIQVCIGPAAYDLASFYSASRWLYARTPLCLTETRNSYLDRLNCLLDVPTDRALFDATYDAAQAWLFLTNWLPLVAERPPSVLARAHLFRAAISEPALASIRRLERI